MKDDWKAKYKLLFFEFVQIYFNDISQEHANWIVENQETMKEKEEKMKNSLFYIGYRHDKYIMRYLAFYEDDDGKKYLDAINPVIRNIFIDLYFVSTFFEQFMNNNPSFIIDNNLRYVYGHLFEKYIKDILIDKRQIAKFMDEKEQNPIVWNINKSF